MLCARHLPYEDRYAYKSVLRQTSSVNPRRCMFYLSSSLSPAYTKSLTGQEDLRIRCRPGWFSLCHCIRRRLRLHFADLYSYKSWYDHEQMSLKHCNVCALLPFVSCAPDCKLRLLSLDPFRRTPTTICCYTQQRTHSYIFCTYV